MKLKERDRRNVVPVKIVEQVQYEDDWHKRHV